MNNYNKVFCDNKLKIYFLIFITERLTVTKLRKQERIDQEKLKIKQQGIKLFASTPTVHLQSVTSPEQQKKVKATSSKSAKQIRKRDKKLLDSAQVERQCMAQISAKNQLVISKLETQLQQVLLKRTTAKPDTKRRKRVREQAGSNTTVSTDKDLR